MGFDARLLYEVAYPNFRTLVTNAQFNGGEERKLVTMY